MALRLIIADDHPLLVDGLKRVLEEMGDIQVLDPVSNGRQLIARLRQEPVDLVLLDLQMPQMDGLTVLKLLQKEFPRIKTLIFTNYNQPKLIQEIKALGAQGCLIKSSTSAQLKEAVTAVAAGNAWFPDKPEEAPPASFTDEFMKKYQVTPREVEIIRKIAQGHTTREIGKLLFLSEFTINAHRRNICRKLEIYTPVGLVNFAKEHGLV